MIPQITGVAVNDRYTLTLTFDNGEVRLFEMQPYINCSDFFRRLSDSDYFRQAKISGKTVTWPDGRDSVPDTLYLKSKPLAMSTQ
jgi:hypothetical protein